VAERLAAMEGAAADPQRADRLTGDVGGLTADPTAMVAALRRRPIIENLLRESGMARLWRQAGKGKGRQEGERERAQQMARVAMEGKFGPLSAALVGAMERADAATLEAVVTRLTTETLEQVRARLGL